MAVVVNVVITFFVAVVVTIMKKWYISIGHGSKLFFSYFIRSPGLQSAEAAENPRKNLKVSEKTYLRTMMVRPCLLCHVLNPTVSTVVLLKLLFLETKKKASVCLLFVCGVGVGVHNICMSGCCTCPCCC